MTGNARFTKLIETHLAGIASPSEYTELMGLIKSGQYDDLLKEKIDNLMLHSDSTADLDDSRARELLDRILNTEMHTAKLIPVSKPVKKYRRWYAAAAALVLIASAIWMAWPGKNAGPQQIAKNDKKNPQA